ncbi:AAA family ATPase [Geothrix sp. 21YS21S-4]|uniref:DNA polymerase III subunit n=1 Tax=Geothrix sp. 21YS21S-4 TaxID=3068889 RepID=UPI0027B8AADA|nr:AAA family ATPase [Geothrix sp. 21YS21S-4]
MFSPHLAGHRALRQRLLDRLRDGRIRGSLLFTGPEGIGKRRVALELAQREICLRRTACGECEGCRMLQGEDLPFELPNLLRIAPEGKAGVIRIDQIREGLDSSNQPRFSRGVIEWASLAPPLGCHRWIIIEEAHRLNESSGNILLKTLEEPPEGTHFILVTHRPEALLQTIRSRCERIPFAPLPPEEAWAVARRQGWDEADRPRWEALGDGSLRFLDEAIFRRAEAQVDAWIALLGGRPFTEAGDALLPERESPLAQGEQLRQPLELLLRVLADLARIRAGEAPSLEPWRGALEALAARSGDLKAPQEAALDALRHLPRNLSPEPLLREVALALPRA